MKKEREDLKYAPLASYKDELFRRATAQKQMVLKSVLENRT